MARAFLVALQVASISGPSGFPPETGPKQPRYFPNRYPLLGGMHYY